jgi:XrtN system VIT domain protein
MKTKNSIQTSPVDALAPVVFQVPVVPWWAGPLRYLSLRVALTAVLLTALFYGGYDYWRDQSGQSSLDLGVFFVHYAVAVGFSLGVLFGTSKLDPRWALRRLGLALWLMSAFALNRTIPVFQVSTGWLAGVVVLTAVLLTGAAWFDNPLRANELPDSRDQLAGPMPVRLQQLWVLLLGVVAPVFLYAAVYMAPLYPISVPGLLALGMSVHTFVPLLIVFFIGKWLRQGWRAHEHLRVATVVGLTLPVLGLTGFLWQWQRTDTTARYALSAAQTRPDDELPNWVLLAQQLTPDWVTTKWLYTGVVYDRLDTRIGESFVPKFSDAPRLHDPLVVIASTFFPPLQLTEGERAKVVSVLFDARHQTTEHLWDGRDLRITNLLTQARIYPEYRLSYTEKTFTIQNRNSRTWDSQEAVFTVHLPEGAVVSSLSLWVNGIEEKGVLTTQAKADTAYRQIVGVESRVVARDPSVVRWLEGNRVSVRVFPCTPAAMRQIKIGITAPLRISSQADGAELVYQNPFFEGPDARQATETVQLDFTQPPTFTQRPDFLINNLQESLADNPRRLVAQTQYQPDWSVRFKAPALSPARFSIAGHSYGLVPATKSVEPFVPKAIYLDINAGWSEADVAEIREVVSGRKVYVYDEGMVEFPLSKRVLLSPLNWERVVGRLRKQRFSVFPVYQIAAPAHALLITKNAYPGPYLDDLSGTPFAQHLSQCAVSGQLSTATPLRTFCLSDPAPTIRSLAELRVLQTVRGSADDLAKWLLHEEFPRPDTPDRLQLPNTNLLLTSETASATKSATTASVAPDHLYRLFAYNDLMRQIGGQYFNRNYLTDKLIHEAEAANIVSPVSGLVVLETQADYDRFGIKRDQHGLENATLKSTGAVPEPHEWALLALLAVLLIGFKLRQRHVRA